MVHFDRITCLIETPWETSGTFNRSWGYHKLDFIWKSSERLLRCLIDNTSRNGNFQLNIGPMSNGKIPGPSIRRMREIGAWLTVNRDAIYGTIPAPYKEPTWGRLTMKGNRLFATVFENDIENQLVIVGIKEIPQEVKILETGQPVEYELDGENLKLKMPEESRMTRLNVLSIDF